LAARQCTYNRSAVASWSHASARPVSEWQQVRGLHVAAGNFRL